VVLVAIRLRSLSHGRGWPWPTVKERCQHRPDRRRVGLRSHGPVARVSRRRRTPWPGGGIASRSPASSCISCF